MDKRRRLKNRRKSCSKKIKDNQRKNKTSKERLFNKEMFRNRGTRQKKHYMNKFEFT